MSHSQAQMRKENCCSLTQAAEPHTATRSPLTVGRGEDQKAKMRHG